MIVNSIKFLIARSISILQMDIWLIFSGVVEYAGFSRSGAVDLNEMTNGPQDQVRVAKTGEGISVAKRIDVVIDIVINVVIDVVINVVINVTIDDAPA